MVESLRYFKCILRRWTTGRYMNLVDTRMVRQSTESYLHVLFTDYRYYIFLFLNLCLIIEKASSMTRLGPSFSSYCRSRPVFSFRILYFSVRFQSHEFNIVHITLPCTEVGCMRTGSYGSTWSLFQVIATLNTVPTRYCDEEYFFTTDAKRGVL